MPADPSDEPTPIPERPVAADVMNASPRTVSPYSTVTEAVMIFRDADCGLVPVVEDGKPLGVVTDRDIALNLATYPDLATRPVSDIMTTEPVSVTPDTPLEQLAQTFARESVRRLLVVDDRALLVGVIAWSDVAPHLSFQLTGRMVSDVVTDP